MSRAVRPNGFTLIEVMIALLIFGMIAAAGVGLLVVSVRGQGIASEKLDEASSLNRLVSALSADLAQAVPRGTRDANGTPLPAFTGADGSGATPMLRLVRGGWSNLDAARRASLQKVEYRWAGEAIERVAYPMVDGAAPMVPAVLLDKVRAVRWRYRIAGAWTDRWEGRPDAALPQAAEISIVRDDGTTLHTMFLVGSGLPPQPLTGPIATPTPGAIGAP